jgi:hypothetical protein
VRVGIFVSLGNDADQRQHAVDRPEAAVEHRSFVRQQIGVLFIVGCQPKWDGKLMETLS